jgi:hypothetical protein
MSASGIQYQYAPLKYAIAIAGAPFGIIVEGFAVVLPPPFERLRICVRRYEHEWVADHYDSGLALNFRTPLDPLTPLAEAKAIWANQPTLDHRTRYGLVESLVKALQWAKDNGSLRERFTRHGFGWCLDEAGL